jgi:hypothetical protein
VFSSVCGVTVSIAATILSFSSSREVTGVLSYTFIFRKQFYFVVSGLKIIGHGNPDNNLESPCSYTEPIRTEVNVGWQISVLTPSTKFCWNPLSTFRGEACGRTKSQPVDEHDPPIMRSWYVLCLRAFRPALRGAGFPLSSFSSSSCFFF